MKKESIICFAIVLTILVGIFSTLVFASADSTIYCPECGKQIAAESKYCMYCGHKIPSASTTSKKPATSPGDKNSSPYIIGTSENTFSGLHKAMCVNLDLKKNPLPTFDENLGEYMDGDYEYGKVLKDDSTSYEYIGYVKGKLNENKYIVRLWRGYHKDGSIIEMVVYYTVDGKYLGNIQRDRTAGTSTSSHNSPYYIPGEPINKE